MQNLRYGLPLVLGSLIFLPCVLSASRVAAYDGAHADPVLHRFVQSVVESNPRVRAARFANVAIAADRDAASQPIYNPELVIGAENADTQTRAIGLNQTLDWGRKRQARTAVADSDRLAAEAAYLDIRWAVTVDLLNGLARHQTEMDHEHLAKSRRTLMEDFALLARRRFDAGDLNQVELTLAQLAYTDARMQNATTSAALADARQEVLAIAPDVQPGQWPSLPSNLPPLALSMDDSIIAVSQLPQVMVARHQADAANALIELRSRERRPDPTISVTGGRESGENLIGIDLTIPLFVRNKFSHEVVAAAARHGQAQQQLDNLTQRAQSRFISARDRYQLSRDAWVDWQNTGQSSLTNQTEQLEKLWQAGEISTTDYLVQLTATLDIQQSALDLRESLWRAWFEWLSASGQVDGWLNQGDDQ
ncbi:MAG: transporter [Lysobacteraceae bacterium]|nr:MAG: transporter [Xanthomonadaceae bacterium]